MTLPLPLFLWQEIGLYLTPLELRSLLSTSTEITRVVQPGADPLFLYRSLLRENGTSTRDTSGNQDGPGWELGLRDCDGLFFLAGEGRRSRSNIVVLEYRTYHQGQREGPYLRLFVPPCRYQEFQMRSFLSRNTDPTNPTWLPPGWLGEQGCYHEDRVLGTSQVFANSPDLTLGLLYYQHNQVIRSLSQEREQIVDLEIEGKFCYATYRDQEGQLLGREIGMFTSEPATPREYLKSMIEVVVTHQGSQLVHSELRLNGAVTSPVRMLFTPSGTLRSVQYHHRGRVRCKFFSGNSSPFSIKEVQTPSQLQGGIEVVLAGIHQPIGVESARILTDCPSVRLTELLQLS